MKIKTTMRCQYTPIKMAKIPKLTMLNASKDVKQQELSHTAGGNEKWYNYFGRQFDSFLQNLMHFFHTAQQLCSLIFYLSKWAEGYVHNKSCMWMFMVALFIIAEIWKQPRYPSVGEWINKLWYIHTLEYHSVLKIFNKWAIKPW